jgi:hypothetical protein
MEEFEAEPLATSPAVLPEVAARREIAEVQAAVILAKRYPRDQESALARILKSCERPGLADAALYSYSRGGTDITGPSIRLAECISQNWGNMVFGIRELEQRPGESTVEAFAWDLETNTRQSKTFQVRHFRSTKKGGYMVTDPRDIYELVANAGARRVRACILGVIPGDVVEAAQRKCEETLKKTVDVAPEKIQAMLTAFESYGVTKDMIEGRIQRKIEAITPANVISLRKIYNSLKDGMSTKEDWFALIPEGAGEKIDTSAFDKLVNAKIKEVPELKETVDKWLAKCLEVVAKANKATVDQVKKTAISDFDKNDKSFWPMFLSWVGKQVQGSAEPEAAAEKEKTGRGRKKAAATTAEPPVGETPPEVKPAETFEEKVPRIWRAVVAKAVPLAVLQEKFNVTGVKDFTPENVEAIETFVMGYGATK